MIIVPSGARLHGCATSKTRPPDPDRQHERNPIGNRTAAFGVDLLGRHLVERAVRSLA
ncbi:hypothetical protein MF672_006795 [Actinomadura sp. ATCC 31491]|uniref:Uncharacterized protein n=1 Tax=Actinomadura luzonensis TaxID=2805427 RepID=A0ABT0FMJ7_9ACTN|nr:hypothetical protein [Actinomadura luzonensis]MCK2213501.1 hypothetical protein [Actinomadura luzonensis]